jgi:hypothetical protein
VLPISLARFRPTVAQAAGRGAARGLTAGAILALAAGLFGSVVGGLIWPVAVVTFLFVGTGGGALLGALGGRDAGVDADDLGLHRVPAYPPLSPPPLAPWREIADIRAERRGGRTVIAIYLASGLVLRLAAPYDGRLFAHDPEFESKLFTLRHLWETHRSWGAR